MNIRALVDQVISNFQILNTENRAKKIGAKTNFTGKKLIVSL
jgi:hypothetical protein